MDHIVRRSIPIDASALERRAPRRRRNSPSDLAPVGMNRKSEFRALITHALFSGDLRRLFLYTAGRTMAPGGGRGSGRGSAPKDETVIMGGQTLRRVMDESTRQWVYRPVDEASGNVITKEAFEARRLAERRLRAEADPRKQAEREKRWPAQQRGEIRNARVEESRAMRRDEHARKLESGLVERRRPRRREIARVPEPELLLELREEMRVALANGLDKKNPGRFAFVKTALDAEEAKHDAAVKSAREKAYAQERKRRGVRGAHDPTKTSHPPTATNQKTPSSSEDHSQT